MPRSLVVSVRYETAPMACRASPRKPKETTLTRSSAVRILLVACSVTERPRLGRHPRAVVADPDQGHPTFLDLHLDSPRPRVQKFSINSLTADAGRSMTSPAAILCATSGDSTRTRPA